MKLISNLAHLDQQAIQGLGIPGLVLMEEAGRQVAEQVIRLFDEALSPSSNVVILCGRGNNGGDGFVCARKLASLDSPLKGRLNLTVIHTAPAEDYQGDAKINMDILPHYPIDSIHASEASWEGIESCLTQAGIIVDALFGSGLTRPIRLDSMEGQLIALTNQLTEDSSDEQTPIVLAVDLPSGVSGETGQVLGCAIHADLTLTFSAGKPGLYLPPGKACCGVVDVVDIGIPRYLIDSDPSRLQLTTEDHVYHSLPIRSVDSHKYSVGCLMVIAGSLTMPGAAQLTAEAALSAGAGLVVLAAPQSVFAQLQLMPEIIHLPLPETNEGTLGLSAIPFILQGIREKKCQAIALGPGLGQQDETQEFVHQLLLELTPLKHPIVIDADGLNALANSSTPTPFNNEQIILTPHVGECARLLQHTTQSVQNNLLQSAQETQTAWACHVLLKSSTMITARHVSNKQAEAGSLWINPTGNSGMATAGSGDVLTGIIASLCAQGVSPEQAASGGAYLHGLAGDLAAEALSTQAMKASDISHYLPQAFQAILQSEYRPEQDKKPT